MIKVKICCIKSVQEAEAAFQAGADAIGLVGDMPSGPGVINDEQIAAIAAQVPPDKKSFLLTSETTPEAILAHHSKVNTTTIQIVDHISAKALESLSKHTKATEIVQVIHVTDESAYHYATEIHPFVDFILLDSGNPNSSVKLLGGTGKTHDWNISKKIVANIPKPVFLAGGLNPENVQSAITQVAPYGLDLCSGVRTNGNLDREKLTRFFAQIKALY